MKTRTGNTITVKRSKCGHYYTALTVNGERVSAWHRTTKQFIKKYYEGDFDYEN